MNCKRQDGERGRERRRERERESKRRISMRVPKLPSVESFKQSCYEHIGIVN